MAAHVALRIGQPMSGAVGAEQTGFRQGAGVPPVGLHLSRPGGVHGREVGVSHDHLVAQPFEAARPLAVGGGFQEDARPGPLSQDGGEALRLAARSEVLSRG